MICNATIIPIDAMIGNNNELSCDEASLIYSTEEETAPILESSLSFALFRVFSNPLISFFKISNQTTKGGGRKLWDGPALFSYVCFLKVTNKNTTAPLQPLVSRCPVRSLHAG